MTYIYITIDVKPCILENTYIYIDVHDYIMLYIYMYIMLNNIFTSMQNLDSHKKPEGGGIGGGCSAPPAKKKNACGTQGVYTGQHASCDHIYIFIYIYIYGT